MSPTDDLFGRGIYSWADIPTSILRAELARRQDVSEPQRPACGTKNKGAYNTPIHVFALVLILVLSTIACAFPVIVRRYPRFPVPHHFIFLSRHFGTGVLIATAFVHLFPTAYVSLTDPCLPPFWNQRYQPMAGLIAMTSVFVVVSIEMFFAMRGAGHVHSSDFEVVLSDEDDVQAYHDRQNGSLRGGRTRGGGIKRSRGPSNIMLGDMNASTDNLIDGRSPSIGQPSPMPPNGNPSRKSTDSADEDLELDLDELNTNAGLLNGKAKQIQGNEPPENTVVGGHVDHSTEVHDSHLTDQAANQRALLQCLLLEAGILFHSVFIGMALSVSTGPPFLVLLVAISFHQAFEGLALGSRIAALHFPNGSIKPWLMALAYGTTTPIGQAIGLAIHTSYDPASETGLLTVGVMNAISSGLLLFAGLVQLLAEDFLSEASYKSLRGRRRYEACGSVIGGALLMALVGAWA
ncbi:uncharacterized protein PV09_04921 [Verruconis gallopava]|uniref:Zinc/iron permease n=1 Tax=Verruconis gallopava TaxID=253628 RepID=A0A0D2AC74_9PEZI|nr:uncharacterized protein PV09_04921 [Verruconis gallopava]KIW04110.1 hypothetical protein PV09_04921 [Verruconis gallopava]